MEHVNKKTCERKYRLFYFMAQSLDQIHVSIKTTGDFFFNFILHSPKSEYWNGSDK